jgi:hypothetical protein
MIPRTLRTIAATALTSSLLLALVLTDARAQLSVDPESPNATRAPPTQSPDQDQGRPAQQPWATQAPPAQSPEKDQGRPAQQPWATQAPPAQSPEQDPGPPALPPSPSERLNVPLKPIY